MAKPYFMRSATALFAALFLPLGGSLQATVPDAIAQAEELVHNLQVSGWKVPDPRVGFLKRGKSATFTASLEKGRHYVFSVGGCKDAYGVDVAILDGETLIASNKELGHAVRVDLVAPEKKDYTVEVRMRDCTPNGAHYCLLFGELLTPEAKK